MLIELTIREFAIIKELKVNFHQGLNVLTGETGAGKSIIIDAIQLIAGGRGSVDYIRNQADKADIEALFFLDDDHPVFKLMNSYGIQHVEDGMLIIKRELLSSGKSICRVNGQLVTLGMLKELGTLLIQLHSQNHHQKLMYSDKQLELLDAYGEDKLQTSKKEFQKLFRRYDELKREVKHLSENEKEIAQRIDLLQYQINEIVQADLSPNEDQELIDKRNRLRNFEKITKSLHSAYQALAHDNGMMELFSHVLGLIEQISSYDGQIEKFNEDLSNNYFQMESVTSEIKDYIDQMDFEEEDINMIEERLSIIYHLKRKYGDSVDSILEYAATIEDELDLIQHKDERLQQLQSKLHDVSQDLIIEAMEISNIRRNLANELAGAIKNELHDLQMKNSDFKINIDYQEDPDGIEYQGRYYYLNEKGLDKINFLISPNLGEPLKPLQKIASGGELSRIMLAILTILSHKDQVGTIIFDEIDTGVSGYAAQAIAEKLAVVSRGKQVFVITHLPQVSSMADYHYLIQKNTSNQSTYTEIKLLNDENRVDELARILGGVEVTETTRKHASEMIQKASEIKK